MRAVCDSEIRNTRQPSACDDESKSWNTRQPDACDVDSESWSTRVPVAETKTVSARYMKKDASSRVAKTKTASVPMTSTETTGGSNLII